MLDMNAKVTGHELGTGKNANRIGALLCVDKKGNKFKCGSGLTDKQRALNFGWTGKIIEVQYFEKSADGDASCGAFAQLIFGELCPKAGEFFVMVWGFSVSSEMLTRAVNNVAESRMSSSRIQVSYVA